MPYYIEAGATVQDGNSFMIVGGYNETFLATIWRFDLDNWTWTLMDQTMKTARDRFAAITVPDYFC